MRLANPVRMNASEGAVSPGSSSKRVADWPAIDLASRYWLSTGWRPWMLPHGQVKPFHRERESRDLVCMCSVVVLSVNSRVRHLTWDSRDTAGKCELSAAARGSSVLPRASVASPPLAGPARQPDAGPPSPGSCRQRAWGCCRRPGYAAQTSRGAVTVRPELCGII